MEAAHPELFLAAKAFNMLPSMEGWQTLGADIKPPSNIGETSSTTTNTIERLSFTTTIMDSDSLMKNRFSCRYYLPRLVDKQTIHEIIDIARYAPSGNNIQPWHKVYCISGPIKEQIAKEMTQAHSENPNSYHGDYAYYPSPEDTPALYAARRVMFGKVFYPPLGVDRDDLDARSRVSARNFEFFKAPVAFVFTIHKGLTKGSWLDLGFFLQSMTIAARARGLESITQESVARCQQILRKHLPIGEDEIVVCGMSMGYSDLEKVSKFFARQPKRDVEDIIEYFGL